MKNEDALLFAIISGLRCEPRGASPRHFWCDNNLNRTKKNKKLRLRSSQHEQKLNASSPITQARGETKGTAAQLRCAQMALYFEASTTAMALSHSYQLTWDGSCHGGKSMLVGACLNPDEDVIALMKPEANG